MSKTGSSEDTHVDAIRAFNRFYTRQLGLLEEKLLESEFSLTEVRVLYELAQKEGLTAAELVRDLGVDPGYLSRIVKKFKTRCLISTRPAPADGRQSILSLTDAGHLAFAPLNQASHNEVLTIIEALHPTDRDHLVKSMEVIKRILGGADEEKVPYVLRPPVPGDLGWITHRQAVLYWQEYGWDETFEALVAEIAGAFCKNFNPKSERCWIAERHGEIVGSVFLANGGGETAKLRLLYVEPVARGLGIGNRLVEECIAFARDRGYREITLWTNSVLTSARRIYEAHGFRLTSEEPHCSFGKDLVGQTWARRL